ncbi:MAG: NADH-quinone oxidoreductase subunit M [Acidobacteria bacterium]|nr:NADH-quinone oxidoreductase subunit M [Acidobacteriota bacterium]
MTLLLLVPLAGLILLLALPSRWARAVALFTTAAHGAIAVDHLRRFQPEAALRGFGFLERLPWIPSFGAQYLVGVDGYSLLLVVMTSLVTLVALVACTSITERLKEYYAAMLVLLAAMTGVFISLDLLLFFLFWELTLIPMYLIIAVWGGTNRAYASMKFLIYTNLGSVLMLIGILALRLNGGTFDYFELLRQPGGEWVFWAFLAGFAVKVPMIPVHTWLPDAHTEAPTAGSVILAGVLLKMGLYGLTRFALPLAPPSPAVLTGLCVASVVAIIYGGLVCLMQQDWKRLIAYSSVSHMGFCTLVLFVMTRDGLVGSMLQQINHAVTTGLLFLVIGAAYDRTHTREIARYSGLLRSMPRLGVLFLIAILGSMGMPPLNGFVGEFTILRGVAGVSTGWAVALVVGVALGAAYLLWLYQRTMLGEPREQLADLNATEMVAMVPLAVLTVLLGVVPGPFFRLLEPVAEVVLKGLGR